MLRKLLILSFLLTTSIVFAQKKKDKRYPQAAAPAKLDPNINYRELGSPLPPFVVKTLDKKQITDADVKNDANFFLMLFNPTCDHCEKQTDSLRENFSLFKKSKLLLVATPPMIGYLPYFIDDHKLKDYPEIMLGTDSALTARTFIYMSLPQINIYDKDRKLIRIFSGNVAIDSLKQYIQ
ncbi:MAG: hypothetical protein WCG87_11025 [Bacteroidota bacterium]